MLVVASVALTLGLVELGSWFWVTRIRPQHLTQWEFRATQPPPYQGTDYFSPEFLAEAEKSVSGTLSTIAELRDFKGRYFNVVNGFRVTTDAPADPVRRVLMFGGSTLFGQEVPDRYTIPSYLQRMLNQTGARWQVLNFGLPGMNTVQQTLILERVRLRKGDIVVFYHGVNDIYYLVFGGYTDGVGPAADVMIYTNLSGNTVRLICKKSRQPRPRLGSGTVVTIYHCWPGVRLKSKAPSSRLWLPS